MGYLTIFYHGKFSRGIHLGDPLDPLDPGMPTWQPWPWRPWAWILTELEHEIIWNHDEMMMKWWWNHDEIIKKNDQWIGIDHKIISNFWWSNFQDEKSLTKTYPSWRDHACGCRGCLGETTCLSWPFGEPGDGPLGPQGGTFAGSEACTCRVHKRFIVRNPWPPG